MHPVQLPHLTAAHQADLLAVAEQRRLARTLTQDHRPLRRRAGWWLVAVGLKLAVGPPTPTPLPAPSAAR